MKSRGREINAGLERKREKRGEKREKKKKKKKKKSLSPPSSFPSPLLFFHIPSKNFFHNNLRGQYLKRKGEGVKKRKRWRKVIGY